MEQLLIALPVLIFSVVIHEYAHGWMAYRQGDQTAAMLGRLTFNPIPHLDPVGSVLVPVLLALMPGGIIFGWARPVPVNPRNFREYRRGDILVSLAGVAANLVVAVACTLLLAVAIWLGRAVPGAGDTSSLLQSMLQFGILINLVLIVFNLIPIPPLDGSHVLVHLLPPAAAMRYREVGRYGMILVLAFLFLGGFRLIAVPVFSLFAWMRSFAIQLGSLPL